MSVTVYLGFHPSFLALRPCALTLQEYQNPVISTATMRSIEIAWQDLPPRDLCRDLVRSNGQAPCHLVYIVLRGFRKRVRQPKDIGDQFIQTIPFEEAILSEIDPALDRLVRECLVDDELVQRGRIPDMTLGPFLFPAISCVGEREEFAHLRGDLDQRGNLDRERVP